MISSYHEQLNYPAHAPKNAVYLPLSKNRIIIATLTKISIEMSSFARNVLGKIPLCEDADICRLLESIRLRGGDLESVELFEKIALFVQFWLIETDLPKSRGAILEARIMEFVTTFFQVFIPQLGIEPIDLNFKLTDLDFRLASRYVFPSPLNRREFVCFDYAFYQLHEEQLFPLLFHSNPAGDLGWIGNLTTRLSFDTLALLEQIRYKLVQIPQKGDLVVYFSTLDGPLSCTHMGVYLYDNKVLSKWGLSSTSIHQIDDVSYQYGNFVRFYRKKYKFACQRKFLNFIKQTKKGASKLVIYDLKKVKEEFIHHFKSLSKSNLEKSLSRSLYGTAQIQLYAQSVLQALALLPTRTTPAKLYKAILHITATTQ